MQALLDAVRQACRPGLWSQGVQLVRGGAVSVEQRDDSEITTRVRIAGRPVPTTTVLYPEDEEWSCDCGSPIEPCAHVAAAIIAVHQGAQPASGAAPSEAAPASAPPRLRYDLVVLRGYLTVERALVSPDGTQQPIPRSPAATLARQHRDLVLDHEDLYVERLLLAASTPLLSGSMLLSVLRGLSSSNEVYFEGRRVRTSAELVLPVVSIEDAKAGIVVRFERAPEVTAVVARGVLLCGDTLRPMGETTVSGDQYEKLPYVQPYPPAALGEFVASALPDLRKRFDVQIHTERLPGTSREARPRIAFELDHLPSGALSVMPTLVYGEPPTARIDDGRLVHLGGDVPRRNPAVERELVFALHDQLNLLPGHRAHFEPGDAPRFVSKLRDFSRKSSGGVKLALERRKVVPELIVAGEQFELRFDLEGTADAKQARHATAEAVVRSWQQGLDLVPLVGGGFADLPRAWMEKHGHLVADLLASRDPEGHVAPAASPLLVDLCERMGAAPPPSARQLLPLLDGSAELPEITLPVDLDATLRPYQETGVRWLSLLGRAQLGSVLADDMGLGKTLQTLAILERGTLVVCPRSVIHNWAAEAARFRPGLRVALYHGPRRELDRDADVTLTTYHTLRSDLEALGPVPWDTVVLDEAQTIKNADSQTARAAYQLQAKRRIALSGTPVENRLEELWSLMHFTNPGLLGPRSYFQEQYVEPILRGDEGVGERLARKIRPFVLRRMKRDVAKELPPRTDITLLVELSPEERALYDAVHQATRKDVAESLGQSGNVLAALEALLRLRQASCHPALLPGREAECSSKIERLLEALTDAAADGHRCLVFSQWTSLLDLVEPHLRAAELSFLRLDGSTRDRAGVVASFQDEAGPPVLLTSSRREGPG